MEEINSAASQRREHARRLLSAPADLVCGPDASAMGVRVIDISLSGVGFLISSPVTAGEICRLRIALPGQPQADEFPVEIVYCVATGSPHGFRGGARMVRPLVAATEAHLIDFLTQPPKE